MQAHHSSSYFLKLQTYLGRVDQSSSVEEVQSNGVLKVIF